MARFFGPWDLGRLLSDTLGIYRKRWMLLIAMVVPFVLIIELIGWRLNLTVTDWTSLPDIDYSSSAAFTALSVVLGYAFLDIIITTVIETMMNCPVIHAIGQHYTREHVSIANAIGSAIKRVLTVLTVILLRILVIAALAVTIVGIPVALYLYVKWMFVTHAILFEGMSVSQALSKSSELARNNWWRILGYLAVIWVIIIFIIFVFISIEMILPAISSFSIMSIAAKILYTPITIISTTLLYFALRVEKEGYHIGRMATDMLAWEKEKRPFYKPDAIVRPHYCPWCGQQLEQQHSFCPNCGKSLLPDINSKQTDDSEDGNSSSPVNS